MHVKQWPGVRVWENISKHVAESYISPAHRLPTAAVAHSPLPALLHLPIHPRHQRYTTICYIIAYSAAQGSRLGGSPFATPLVLLYESMSLGYPMVKTAWYYEHCLHMSLTCDERTNSRRCLCVSRWARQLVTLSCFSLYSCLDNFDCSATRRWSESWRRTSGNSL